MKEMEKMKESLSKNNYLMVKIIGGMLAVAIVIGLIFFLTSRKEETSNASNTTAYEERTTSEIQTESIKETTAEESSSVAIETSEVISEEEVTTNITSDTGDISTVLITTEKQTTKKVITTQKPTTTKLLETTTEEETTSAPRGANGVILETLTVQYTKKEPYTIPETWEELKANFGDGDFSAYCVTYFTVKEGRVLQNVLGNEVELYSVNDSTGSAPEDIFTIYGKPMYDYSLHEGATRLIWYKYKITNYGEEKNIYIRFEFSSKTDGKLASVMASNLKDEIEDGEIVP